jgi:prepilin-type N-terminal cleavage/methylation domain-containing protein
MAWFSAKGSGKNGRRQQGFTIIELMIVLLILGILVGMVVMTMEVTRAKAQQAACKANLKIITDAVAQYQAVHNGANPPTLDTLATDSFIKSSFKWICPSGNLGAQSGDYRDYYNPATGETSCPRKNHNP